HFFFPFITAFFGLFRLRYHLSKPLIIGAALHNLCEWLTMSYAYNDNNNKRKHYAIISSIYMAIVITLVMVITQFPYFLLVVQFTGVIADVLLPITWFVLVIKNINNSVYRNIFFVAFLAHFIHLLFTIYPLLVVNMFY